MEFLSSIYLLSAKFIQDYPASSYPELMYKDARPYTCLLIDIFDDFFICVPFRSSINHKNSFLFKNSKRSRRTKSGLDYSKIVIIKDLDYIDSTKSAVVDKDEYTEMTANLPQITKEVVEYVSNYINHIKNIKPLHPKQFSRIYKFTTLKYFHDILTA